MRARFPYPNPLYIKLPLNPTNLQCQQNHLSFDIETLSYQGFNSNFKIEFQKLPVSSVAVETVSAGSSTNPIGNYNPEAESQIASKRLEARMEFVTLFADKLLEYTLTPVARQVGYVFFYKKNVSQLKEQAEELRHARESVQHRVDAATRNVEEIEGEVLKWLSDMDEIGQKVKLLQEDKRHKNTGVSGRSFPNLWWRHQLGRKAKKLAQEIEKSKKQFDNVSYVPEKTIETRSWGEAFESRAFLLNQIVETLEDPNHNMIGVHGLGGVGKTTLVNQVAEKAKGRSSDLKAIIITVKQTPEIKELQQEIAERLQLELKEQTLDARARKLQERLTKEKMILVILDDLWEKLDLDKLGIPCGKENKNCKVLMTSRNKDVFSNIEKSFQLEELTSEEAWKLFKEKAALSEYSEGTELMAIANDVSSRCARLPVAIVTIAAALKGKDIAEWRDVQRQLRDHRYRDVNKSIELSYQYLKDAHLKSIFLLAGMVTSSSIMDLFKYSCGLGLFDEIAEMKEMQDSFKTSIRKLKDLYLLQDSDESDSHFTMHDIVRDTAIMIASRDQQWFLKKNRKLDEEEWAKNDKLKSCVKILLDFNDIERFPERLQFSNLIFFYLHNKNPSLKFPHSFFEGMPALKVLVLIKMNFEFLPSSISHLHNLHTLCLHQCLLENIDGITILKGLKILSLNGSEITDFPREIGQLTKLQLLDLSCFELKFIPSGVLSKLKMLEVLLTGTSLDMWAVGDQQSIVSLTEIKDLSRLNTLTVHVRDANMLPKEKLFESLLKLQRYEVRIGTSRPYYFGYSKTSRSLWLDLHDMGIDSKHYFKGLLDRAEDFVVQRLKGVKNVVPDMNENGLLELKQLKISENDDLQFIADSMEHRNLFLSLESLHVGTSNLVKLCNGSITNGSFSKLKVVKVNGCSKMKSLFSFSLPTCLPHLNEIEVGFCRLLEGIVFDDGKLAGVLQFRALRTLKINYVPRLIGFYFEDKTSSKAQEKKTEVADDKILDPPIALFSHKVSLPNLETLDIEGADKLNNVWDRQIQQFDELSFHNLKILTIRRCRGISKLLPFDVLEFLHNLEKLEVNGCDSLEVIFDLEGTRKADSTHDAVKSVHLRELILQSLRKLEHVWNKKPQGIVSVQFRELRTLKIEGVPELIGFCFKDKTSFKAQQKETEVSLFSHKVAVPKLENLSISGAHKLNSIWDWQHDKSLFQNLKTLYLSHCRGIIKLLPFDVLEFLHNLEKLEVCRCDSLEVIFDLDGARKEEIHAVVKPLHLSVLNFGSLPKLKHVWNKDPKGILNFQCLSEIQAWECHNLKYLFPVSMPNSLSKLQDLSIKYCREFENIVGGKEDGAEVSISFELSQVTSLTLEYLPKLTRFYPGLYSTKWPQLQKFSYRGVDKVWNIFGGGLVELEKSHCEDGLDEASIQRPLPIEEPISELRELDMDYNENMMAYLEQYSPDFCFRKLKLLKLESFNDVSSAFLWSFIQRMNTLKTLNVQYCSFEELFPLERVATEETQNDNRIHLKQLIPYELSILKHICREGNELDPILKDLEELQILRCSSLLRLVPSSVVFNHLTSLQVCYCDKISYLMAPSTAKSLTKLTIMKINGCIMIKEIVAGKVANDEITDVVTFNNLKTLELQYLYQLESFCSINYPFHFPSLENVIIEGCPKMKTFSKLHPKSPKLQIAKHDFSVFGNTYYEGDLNSIVKKLHIHKLYYETGSLSLSEYPDLEQIWHSKLPKGAFRSLRILKLSNCEWFSEVLPLTVLKCLVNLEELKVENCKSVEVVFDLDQGTTIEERHNVLLMNLRKMTLTSLPNLKHVWNKDPQGIRDFPKLTKLALVDVPKLDPHSVEQAIPNLMELVVDETTMKWLEKFPADHFNKLEDLELTSFKDENTTFPYSFLQKKSKLEVLCIKHSSFEEIFPFEKQADMGNQHGGILQVKSLKLEYLHNLRHICKGHELDPTLKNLEELYVEECSRLLNLVPSSTTFNLLKVLYVRKCEQLLYLMASSTAKSLGQLEKLVIGECGMIKEVVIDKVVDAETIDEITFNKLKILKLKNLTCLESFCSMNYVFNFPSLENVDILECPKLKTFSKQAPSTPKLQNVKNMKRKGAEEWEGDLNSTVQKLWPSSITFNLLKTLIVMKCEQLLYLMASSTAKCLRQLEVLVIGDCRMIKEIIADKVVDDEIIEEITFNKLIVLKLENLTYLESFCSMNYAFNFPSLGNVIVLQCPNLKIFSKGVCYAPILTSIYVGGKEIWEGDLNSTVQKLYKDTVASQKSDNALSEVDTMSENKQLNELEKNHQVEEEKDEESKREDDDREHEDMKLGNKNMKVIEQCTRENGLQTSTNEDLNMSTPLAASNQEIQTSEEGDNRKLEDRNITEQSTPEMQTQGFNVPISNFDMTSELPIGRAKEEASVLQKETSKVEIVQVQLALEGIDKREESCNQKMMEQSNVTEQSTGNHSESREAHQKQTRQFDLSINNFDVTSAELSLMHAIDEAFDLQNETSKGKKVQVQLALESTDTDGGGNANTPNVDLPIGVYVEAGVKDTDIEPTDLNINNKTKQWDNFGSGVGLSCSSEVEPNNVIHSTQDRQESDKFDQSNSFLQTQTMTVHSGELQTKEIRLEQKIPHIGPINKGENLKGIAEETAQNDPIAESSATSGPPVTSDVTIPPLLEDLLSRLRVLLSSEAVSYLQHGFSRYHWALHLLESWSDKIWNWSYFVIFARVLCILQTTAAANLSEALCAELSSSLSTLGNVGFDANWIAAVHTRIRDCQASLTNLHEAKTLRATKEAIAGQLREFESLVDAMRTELAGIDSLLAEYAHREELAHNVIGLP